LLVASFAKVEAAILFEDNFESYPVGAPPGGWTDRYTVPGEITREEAAALGTTIKVTDSASYAGGQSVHFLDPCIGGVSAQLWRTFPQASHVVLEYYTRSDSADWEGAFVNLNGDGGADYMVGFTGYGPGGGLAGYLYIFGGRGGWIHPLMPYTEGVWYYVRRELDCSTNTGTFYVCEVGNPAKEATYSIESNYVNTYIDSISIWTSNSQGADAYVDELVVSGASIISVAIDIKPGSDPNSINLGAEGVVPVAILTTPDFDAASVDEFSLTLSGSAVRLKGKSDRAGSLEDVDGDGDLDLVIQFDINELALQEGATQAVLEGFTLDGTPIMGKDSVRIVK
jgi:hypothetical protein